ncbi:MAG TPA: hypothetical protein VK858_03645 [Longimicrobiales bacterium]|nr:hypothetical protein [Longimicrobiales bacterium]
MTRKGRIALITGLAIAAAGVAVTLVVRDQVSRARRDLFSPHSLRRLAALSHLRNAPASVDLITLLRDFISWEPRPLLRNRARAILERMQEEVHEDEALIRAI